MDKQDKKTKRTVLNRLFPGLKTRAELLAEILGRADFRNMFLAWETWQQEEFLSFCTGKRGVKVLYDGFFKEIFSPEIHKERLEKLLSEIMGKKVRIRVVLPNDSSRLGMESALLYLDIVVELEDGSLANVEIQRLGYAFPGQRGACYSADLLLRQYKRVRGEKGKKFTYLDIRNVYTIVIFEQSAKEFHAFPEDWRHHFKQQSDTGLALPLLQEFYFIPLDIFKKNLQNRGIRNEFDAWLVFLSCCEPEWIEELLKAYPEFKVLYEDICQICQNTERVMGLFSSELAILDKNTERYMIDEMREEADALRKEIGALKEESKAMQEKMNAAQEKMNAAQEKMNAAQEKAKAAQEKVSAAQKKASAAQKEASVAQEKAKAAQEKAKAAQEKAASEKDRADAVQRELEKAYAQIEQLKREKAGDSRAGYKAAGAV